MQYYEYIPDLVTAAVRSLYREQYVDFRAQAPARLFESLNSHDIAQTITLLASQLAFVVSLALIAFIAFISIRRKALQSQTKAEDSGATPSENQTSAEPAGALRARWDAILQHLESTHEGQWKLAVIEADKLVDDALAKSGYPGATFGDRLSNIQPGTLLSLDGIWWAHKVRNRLAHEIDYFLRYTEARQAVGYYEAALAELRLI